MYALTGRRFANMVCKKAAVIDIKVGRYYSSHALDMKLKNDLNKIRDTMPNLPFQASSIFSVSPPTSRNLSTTTASFEGDNTSATTTLDFPVVDSGSGGGVAGIGEAKQVTKIETSVSVKINLNGSGVTNSNSGIPFLDEMLHQFASIGKFDVDVKATGDIDFDEDHTNEEVAEAIGTALRNAVGDRKDIKRFGSFCAPHHEALVHAALDLSGHPHLVFDRYYFNTTMVGTYDTELLEPFFDSLVNTSGMTLHLRNISGSNTDTDTRDITEATFKAFAGALRQATEYDPRRLPLLLEHSQIQNE